MGAGRVEVFPREGTDPARPLLTPATAVPTERLLPCPAFPMALTVDPPQPTATAAPLREVFSPRRPVSTSAQSSSLSGYLYL